MEVAMGSWVGSYHNNMRRTYMSETLRQLKNLDKKRQYVQLIEQQPDFIQYTYWEALEDRKILLNCEIDDNVVETIIHQIFKWNEEDKDVPVEQRKEIKLYINTPGGALDIGMVLCNVIQQSKTPIKGIVLGLAASMGSLITMGCHKRVAYPYSNILIHSGSMSLHGTTTQVEDTMMFHKEKEKQIKDYILSNTKITEEKYKEMYRNEWWLSAKSALEYGIIDEIL